MLMNMNVIKLYKLIDISAIIYDLLYWIKKIIFDDFFVVEYFQLNGQKLKNFTSTDAAPDPRLFVHFVKPSKKRFYFNTVRDSFQILLQCHFTTAL